MVLNDAVEIIKEYRSDPEAYNHKLAEYIEALEFWAAYQSNILAKIFPENSGHYFICGEGGEKNQSGLPKFLFICPQYGADFRATYTYERKDI